MITVTAETRPKLVHSASRTTVPKTEDVLVTTSVVVIGRLASPVRPKISLSNPGFQKRHGTPIRGLTLM